MCSRSDRRAAHVEQGFSPGRVEQGVGPVGVKRHFTRACVEQGFSPVRVRRGFSPVRVQQRSSVVVVALGLAVIACAAGCRAPGHAPEAKAASAPPPRVLRVCADPNNLPFSNSRGEGFENRIASLVARDLHARLEYTWWAQRRGFIRNTLKARECDVVMGLPSGVQMAATTRPYYRSTYVFVSRDGRAPRMDSFDDRRLRTMKIGVQIIGDDYANAPPAHALTSRRMIRNVVGYPVYGDYAQPDPPRRIIDAVASGQVDIAVAWGPLAGFFAARSPVPLQLTPVVAPADLPFLPFTFDIAMGVRRGDKALRTELDTWIAAHRQALDQILAEFHIPRVDRPAARPPGSDPTGSDPIGSDPREVGGGRR